MYVCVCLSIGILVEVPSATLVDESSFYMSKHTQNTNKQKNKNKNQNQESSWSIKLDVEVEVVAAETKVLLQYEKRYTKQALLMFEQHLICLFLDFKVE